MQRQYSWPSGHWGWPVALSHQHGVRAGQFVFTGGQADLDQHGAVQHPGDLAAQVASVIGYLQAVLEDLNTDFNDLVRLVVYFVGDAEAELAILNQLAAAIGPSVRPVVSTISLPELCYPDMLIELEGVAMRGRDNRRLPRQCFHLDTLPQLPAAFSHVLRCDDLVLTSDLSALGPSGEVACANDIVAQTTLMMEQLCVALAQAGVSCDDVLKLNVYYCGDGTAQNWQQPALIRQRYFRDPGPAATGMTVPAFAQAGLMSKIAVTAMAVDDHSGRRQLRRYSWPDGHWNWTTPLPYKHGNQCGKLIHLGGQVSLDSTARVLDPNDMVAQTRRAMANIEKVLTDLNATLDDVVKVTAFYVGGASAEDLHQNLLIRSDSFASPGPATSGIPMPSLVYENMLIEIEVIAVLE